jgi:hypothetical protein
MMRSLNMEASKPLFQLLETSLLFLTCFEESGSASILQNLVC